MNHDEVSQADADRDRIALLEEGAGSYLEAFTAIVVFQREIRSVCEQALTRRLKEYGEALNVNLSDYQVVPSMTSDAELDGTCVCLGVKQVGFSPPVVACWCESYYELIWNCGESSPWLTACVGIYVNNGRAGEELFKAFKAQDVPEGLKLEKEGKTIWLFTTLSPTDMSVVHQKLDAVLTAWIQLWRGMTNSLTEREEEKESEVAP